MKKLIIVVIFCALFLFGCSLNSFLVNKEPTSNNDQGLTEGDNNENKPDDKTEGDLENNEEDPNGEEDPNNNGENPNGEDDPNNNGENQEINEELSFLEDDFKYEIIILNKENYKKTFKKDNYLDFYNIIKEFTYEKYEQCTSCTDVLYTIKYNNNVILVYEYNFFKINDELFVLKTGSFDFLKDYEYTNSESSGWLPWI